MTTSSAASLDPAQLAEVAGLLARAESALFITGAGISADSGLPTYRGVGGLYNDGGTEEGYPIEVALSGHMLARKPEVAWRHIARIEEACRGARANRGHEIIALLEQRLQRVWVLTQNVDGFHRDAGSHNLIEMHGNVHHLVCMSCTRRQTVEDYAHLHMPPRCEPCGGMIRPEVVLFGEMLASANVAQLTREVTTGFDIVFSIGTTSAFPYIAQPVLAAKRAGKVTVEINPGASELSDAFDHRLRSGARDALEAIWQALPAA